MTASCSCTVVYILLLKWSSKYMYTVTCETQGIHVLVVFDHISNTEKILQYFII